MSTARVPSVEVADHLVAEDERERHDRLEVTRRLAVDGREVAAADAGETRPEAHPPVGRASRRVDVFEREWPVLGAAPGDEATGDRGRRELGELAFEHERLHAGAPVARASRSAEQRRERDRSFGRPPGDLRKSSMSQPRLRAMVARLGLGIDRHGEADGFEHRQIGRRVGVGDRLAQREAVLVGEVDEGLRAGLAGRRYGREAAVVDTVPSLPSVRPR